LTRHLVHRLAEHGSFYGEYFYRTDVGADANGDVHFSLEVPLPPGEYPMVGIKAFVGDRLPRADECFDATIGCAVLSSVPRSTPQPQLQAGLACNGWAFWSVGEPPIAGAKPAKVSKTTPTSTITPAPKPQGKRRGEGPGGGAHRNRRPMATRRATTRPQPPRSTTTQ
jgi:hypothetical protein